MESIAIKSALAADTLKGLLSSPKYLLSKYFYDDAGSTIFQHITAMPEYYLTRCEEEILSRQKEAICSAFIDGNESFSLVELGSGDGFKTRILLRHLNDLNISFNYIPVDISQKANVELQHSLRREFPAIEVYPQTGDYIQQLQNLNGLAQGRKVILFLGSNIGNFSDRETDWFLKQISAVTFPGDKLLIGFDLKKSPHLIMRAYNDSHGVTRKFNLNMLVRLNRELKANFNVGQYEHHTEYNPVTGEVKSYLVSVVSQEVYIDELNRSFSFGKWEPIFMERSRKYDSDTIKLLAEKHGFRMVKSYCDSRCFFVDALWEKL